MKTTAGRVGRRVLWDKRAVLVSARTSVPIRTTVERAASRAKREMTTSQTRSAVKASARRARSADATTITIAGSVSGAIKAPASMSMIDHRAETMELALLRSAAITALLGRVSMTARSVRRVESVELRTCTDGACSDSDDETLVPESAMSAPMGRVSMTAPCVPMKVSVGSGGVCTAGVCSYNDDDTQCTLGECDVCENKQCVDDSTLCTDEGECGRWRLHGWSLLVQR